MSSLEGNNHCIQNPFPDPTLSPEIIQITPPAVPDDIDCQSSCLDCVGSHTTAYPPASATIFSHVQNPVTHKFFNLVNNFTQFQFQNSYEQSTPSSALSDMSEEIDDYMDVDKDSVKHDDHEFPSICVPSCDNKTIIHLGQPDFNVQMMRYFPKDEMRARYQLIKLKRELRRAEGDEFWRTMMEGLSNITGSQYAFIAKRILKDDIASAVEMPALGEEGSCLMGLVYYVRDDEGKKSIYKDMQYKGYSCPCAHMRHEKVLVIPDNLSHLFPDNPNDKAMPFPAEAYLAIPLFADDKCYGHIGLMWSQLGLEKRPGLSWAYIECMMHVLEDLITLQVLEASNKTAESDDRSWYSGPTTTTTTTIIPKEDVTLQQTIRPAARNLSHELRTPLQGVVGMLDVMSAHLDTLNGEVLPPQVQQFASEMRKNIENCQDSSQRVVDAADNMVHALDLNREIAQAHHPSALPSVQKPLFLDAVLDTNIISRPLSLEHTPTKRLLNGTSKLDSLDLSHDRDRLVKRRRQMSASPERHIIQPVIKRSKTPDFLPVPHTFRQIRGGRANSTPPEESRPSDEDMSKPGNFLPLPPIGPTPTGTYTIHQEASGRVTLNHKRLNLKEFISGMLQVALKSGGRPEDVKVATHATGEIVTATRRTGKLEIDWSVDFIPPVLIIDKLTLEKTLYAVLHNAVKFTPNGHVRVTASIPPNSNFVHFKVKDSGPGIRPQFIPDVFRMWQRADNSLDRKFDGVGLGLFVAKSLAMKLGGDITLVHTSSEAPSTGSEFHIILPIEAVKEVKVPRSGSPALMTRKSITRKSVSRESSNITSAPVDATILPPTAVPQIKPQISEPTPTHQTMTPYRPREPIRRGSRQGSINSKLNGSANGIKAFDRELGKKIPLRILVAEDNQINRGLLVNMLKRLGFTDILEAVDGAHAVEVMEDHHERPVDLILMDLWMPRMNGIEATEKIMALPRYSRDLTHKGKDLIVLAVSADASPDAQRDVVRVGMTGFLKKPHTIPALEQLIREHCTSTIT